MSQCDMGLLQYLAELEKEREERGRGLAELERVLGELDIAIAHARRRAQSDTRPADLPRGEDSRAEDKAKNVAAHPYAGMGNEAAVLAYLQGVSTPKKTSEVVGALRAGGLESEATNLTSTIFGSLKRLVEKGKAKKVGAGRRMRWAATGGQASLI